MKNYEEYTDEELVDRLHQGENEIMDYILEKYKPLVRKQTNALFLIGGENEDLIQEGMIGLFKAIHQGGFAAEKMAGKLFYGDFLRIILLQIFADFPHQVAVGEA